MDQPSARLGFLAAFAILATAIGPAPAPARGQGAPGGVLTEGFEDDRTAWVQEETDATITLYQHDRSDRAAHDGRTSERFHFEAGPGSALYYSYALPRVPVVDDLKVDLYVRSDHVGIQLFGRVVLPADIDPDTGQASFVLVPGTIFETADRWQRLSLVDLPAEVERRARVLRAGSRRPVSLEGAYLEQLVVNLYGGPGETLVYLDDLRVAPVPDAGIAQAPRRPSVEEGPDLKPSGPDRPTMDEPPAFGSLRPPTAVEATGAGGRVRLDRNRLSREGKPWVFTAIEAPGAEPGPLLQYGFDVLAVDAADDPARALEAARAGFLLMPDLATRGDDPQDSLELASAFPAREAVAFWDLGEDLGRAIDRQGREAERDRVRDLIAAIHHAPAPAPRLTTAGVSGLLADYARAPKNLDLMGVHPTGWGSSFDLKENYHHLARQRDLTAIRNPEALFWTWIKARPPEEVHQAVWGHEPPESGGLARVQPEQVRLYAYAALMAGYRGLGFRADADLTRAPGRAMLLEMALLNAEIDLIQSIVAQGEDPIRLLATYRPDPPVIMVYTSPGTSGGAAGGMSIQSIGNVAQSRPEVTPNPTIHAASISTLDGRGKLLLIADLAPAAQWQPPQLAMNDLTIRVPGVPQEARAYEISLGKVRVLNDPPTQRVPGGIQITLPDFGPTALVLVTTDRATVDWLEAQVDRIRSVAIPMAIEQARLQYQWVAEGNGRLAALGHETRDAADLLQKAELGIKSAEEALARAASSYDDYGLAWSESRRVGRPLRVLMYNHFTAAMEALRQAATPPAERDPYRPGPNEPKPKKKLETRVVTPVSSPPSLAFNTLPQHFLWVDWIAGATFGEDLLPSGSFNDPDDLKDGGWVDEGYATDGIRGSLRSWEDKGPGRRGRVLRLAVEPEDEADKTAIDRLPQILDHPPAAIRTPPIPVGDRNLYRISAWVKMPRASPVGALGLVIRDSLGGEPLQFRTTASIPAWNQVILYRRSPAEGSLTVTIGLAGYGELFVDDLRVEPIAQLGDQPFQFVREEEKRKAFPALLEPPTRPTARNVFPFRIAR